MLRKCQGGIFKINRFFQFYIVSKDWIGEDEIAQVRGSQRH